MAHARHPKAANPDLIERVQRDSSRYFALHGDRANGLILDSTQNESPVSIAVVGFGLTVFPIAVRHGWMSRSEAVARVLAALHFFHDADQSGAHRGVGYKGFFFHFLHAKTGERVWESELSTIDTALLVAGMLFAARYFDGDSDDECELRRLATAIYERIDWRWAQDNGHALAFGWLPETKFLPWRWIGYSEALVLYALALGSPTHPVDADAYAEWLSGYEWKRIYGHAHLYAGPLFIHQFSHLWIDFREIRDEYMRRREIDYFENSRRATHVHREYAMRNPHHWKDYHGDCWGLTACDGPGPAVRHAHGHERTFYNYLARGAPYGPDDGTVAPWASIASLPFAPEIVLPTIACLAEKTYNHHEGFGFARSFNPTFHEREGDGGWISPYYFGLHLGPIAIMIENFRDGFVWKLMRECPPIVTGLRRCGFRGGWLDKT